MRTAIEKCETEISALETSVSEWDARLATPEEYGIDLADPSVFENYNALKRKLELRMHEWEKLNYELDILTGE